MGHRIKWMLIIFQIIFYGCGVKSRPLPPITPPPIGTGSPETKIEPEPAKQKKKANPDTIGN